METKKRLVLISLAPFPLVVTVTVTLAYFELRVSKRFLVQILTVQKIGPDDGGEFEKEKIKATVFLKKRL